MFSNTGKQAAVFHVYNRLDLTAIPRRYMVERANNLMTRGILSMDSMIYGYLDQMVFTVRLKVI